MNIIGDASPDRLLDVSAQGQWLTYDEIGQIRGIGREGAVQLARRKRWRRQPGSDGTMRIFVPGDGHGRRSHQRRTHSRDRSTDQSADHYVELSRAVAVFTAALTSLTARVEAAEQRAVQAESRTNAIQAALAAEQAAGLAAEAAAQQAHHEAEEAVRAAHQGRVDAEEAAETATKAAQLRQLADQARAEAQQAVQVTEALRADIARTTAVIERPSMVASKIDEVQLRRASAGGACPTVPQPVGAAQASLAGRIT